MSEQVFFNGQNVRYSHLITDAPDPSHFERHCHNDFEVLYVVKGGGKYVVEGTEYPLAPHTLLLTRPNEFHYVCPDSLQTYERYVINFSLGNLYGAAALLPLLQTTRGNRLGVYFADLSQDQAVISLFCALDALTKQFSDQSAVQTVFECELSKLLLLLSLNAPTLPRGEETVIMRVIAFINDNLTKPLTLDTLAEEFFISKYHLCHLFRAATGVSVLYYISTKRVAYANRLLSSGMSATEVAYTLGYENYSSFYRTFCKHTGHPPVRQRD